MAATKKPSGSAKKETKITKAKIVKKVDAVKKSAEKKKAVTKKATTAKKSSASKKASVVKSKAKATTTKKPAAVSKAKGTTTAKPKSVAPVNLSETPEYVSPQPLAGVVDFIPYTPRDNEEYMSDLQYGHFRQILMSWRDKLLASVDHTVTHMKAEAISCPDLVDRASLEEGFSLELRTRDRERKLLRKIEQALQSMESGEYGYCEDCGSDIGIRRLEARPTATKCIDCKTFEEIKEKQTGS